MLACSNGKPEAIEFLLSLGASIKTRTNDGYNLLHKAASYGHLSTVDLLLSKGVSLLDKDKLFRRTPIEKAASQYTLFKATGSLGSTQINASDVWESMIYHMLRWPFLMGYIVLDELRVADTIDDKSLIDLYQFCGLAN